MKYFIAQVVSIKKISIANHRRILAGSATNLMHWDYNRIIQIAGKPQHSTLEQHTIRAEKGDRGATATQEEN
jgi:hypothetical protein